MEMNDIQEYIDYLQALLVASYSIKPSLTQCIEDKLEALAIDKGQDKEQAKNDVRQILNLKKALAIFLKNIAEKKFQNVSASNI